MPDTSAPQPRSEAVRPRLPFVTRLIATGLFSGYSPVASGTAGSIVGVLLYAIPGMSNPWILLGAILIGFAAGVGTSAAVVRVVGDAVNPDARLTKRLFQHGSHAQPDPSIVVIDEIVGMWISLWWLPPAWPVIVCAFIFFRIFDTVKPFPAARLENIPNGWGIMLDDVAAGVYANVAVRIVRMAAGF